MMTREEIQELLSAANVILASARSKTKSGKLRVAIGDAQDYIYRARRALEAEKPLVSVKGAVWAWPRGPLYLYELEPGGLELTPSLGADAGGQRREVIVAIYAKEEAAR